MKARLLLKQCAVLLLLVYGLSSCKTNTVVIRKPHTPVGNEQDIAKEEIPDPITPDPIYEDGFEEGTSDGHVMPATLELQINKVLKTADEYFGTRHVLGGLSKKGIDCSGLVMLSYKSIDVSLPRSTRDQVHVGSKVSRKNLRKGDLVFFTYPGGKRITHVGIVYAVNGPNDIEFIHTSSSKGVRKDQLQSGYWEPLLVKSRRVLDY